HDLHDRALAEHRGANAGAHEALLGDRRVAHAVGPELLEQSGGDLVGAVEDAHLLAHHEDARVALHLLAQGEAQRLAIGHDLDGKRLCMRRGGGHSPRPPSNTRSSSPSGLPGRMRSNWSALPGAYTPAASSDTSGSGSASANATAAATRSAASRSRASSSEAATPDSISRARVRTSGSCVW